MACLSFDICLMLFTFIEVIYAFAPTYNFNKNEIRQILNEHNRLRGLEPAQNMQEMVWDANLAKIARDWASRCVGQHRPNRQNRAGYNYIGENLWWITYRQVPKDLGRFVRDLYNEKPYYNFNTGACSAEMCGHYTQVVWANTCAVGCAAAFCDYIAYGRNANFGVMIACNYGPGGNIYYQKPYVYGQRCRMCPNSCTNGLCATTCRGQRTIPYNYYNSSNTATTASNNIQPKHIKYMRYFNNRATTTQAKTSNKNSTNSPAYQQPPKTTQSPRKSNDQTMRPQTTTNYWWRPYKPASNGCVNYRSDCPKFREMGLCHWQKNYMYRYCRPECDPACAGKKL